MNYYKYLNIFYRHLGTILRALGRVVTNADIQAIGEKVNLFTYKWKFGYFLNLNLSLLGETQYNHKP